MSLDMEKIMLPNGVRLLLEHIPGMRTASFGIWAKCGSRYEAATENGMSHFIEHMLFKGTENRSTADIAMEFDRLGGSSNAYTTKETTAFYVRTLDTHLDRALDLLTDMFFRSRFDDRDAEPEKSVIFEEIDMYEDTPDDLVIENLSTAVYAGSPLAFPIIGTRGTLTPMRGADLRAFRDAHYTPGNTVVAVSGSFGDDFTARLADAFGSMPRSTAPGFLPAGYRSAFVTVTKPIEQTHLCVGFPGLPWNDPDRYAASLLTGIFGGGMSSRLFQRVREEAGLCYSISAMNDTHADTGYCCIYTGLHADAQQAALGLIRSEIDRLLQDGPTSDELDLAREQNRVGILMAQESNMSRMSNLAASELRLGRLVSADESLARLDAVTLDDLRRAASRMYDLSEVSLSAVGSAAETDMYRAWLGL